MTCKTVGLKCNEKMSTPSMAAPAVSKFTFTAILWPTVVATEDGDTLKLATGDGALFTVTLTEEDVVLFPAASRATAVKVCVPFVALVVSQVTVYGADVSKDPKLLPSS